MGQIRRTTTKKPPAKRPPKLPAELTVESVAAYLLELGTRRDLAQIYANAYCEYREAQENIAKNGTICSNPRTGAPIENPYLKVRDRAEAFRK